MCTKLCTQKEIIMKYANLLVGGEDAATPITC